MGTNGLKRALTGRQVQQIAESCHLIHEDRTKKKKNKEKEKEKKSLLWSPLRPLRPLR
jgi:hypothetical protein